MRRLFDELNRTAKAYVVQPQCVSIDEGMIRYFGPHPLKQYMKGKPNRFGYKMWILATAEGELLRVQPYAGASTAIKDFGLGQGPNVVLGLVEQFNLLPGSKVYCDNLFLSMDLLDHMSDRQYGVTGTLRQNRLHDIPLTSKKMANKELKRGDHKAIYTEDKLVVVWQDNQPVFMASNCDDVEPASKCQRYSSKEKKYVSIPQPNINVMYNTYMGGVDLLDSSVATYAISVRVKKWYWPIYPWWLNVNMVQSWRLYRAHHKEKHHALQVEEDAKDCAWEERMELLVDKKEISKVEVDKLRKKRDTEKKNRRRAEKKVEDISLLDFERLVVEMILQKHKVPEKTVSQKEASAKLTSGALSEVRYDSGRHLVKLTKTSGVCKHCKETLKTEKRTTYRCDRCMVALHPACFFDFHVLEEER